MDRLVEGQRLDVGDGEEVAVEVSGPPERAALAAITRDGRVVPLVRKDAGLWELPPSGLISPEAEIVCYTTDRRNDVLASDLYPMTLVVGSRRTPLPRPSARLGLVVVLWSYERQGRRRLRIGGDGFLKGPEAYAAAKGIDESDLPFRSDAVLPDPAPSPDRRYDPPGTQRGSGSGVVVAPGVVVTNAHVVEGGTCFVAGRGRARLDVVAIDSLHDLAVLRGDVAEPCLRLRRTAGAWLGEPVIAAGYPLVDLLGADLKASSGNVSGLAGTHGDVSRFQFTAPIGSGSSGGAVADERGNLIGVTSASLSHGHVRERGSVSENVNFAVKACMVAEILASVGVDLPEEAAWEDGDRRQAVARLRASVVRVAVHA